VAGGLELDAEYFENLLFPKRKRGQGGTPPTLGDLTEFKKTLHKGAKDEYEGYWLYISMAGLPKKPQDIINLWQIDMKDYFFNRVLPQPTR
jgi:hypothetical protein